MTTGVLPTCRWPRGCEQDRALCPELGALPELCYYHGKVATGMLTSVPRRVPGLTLADQVNAERLELLDILVKLGGTKAQARRVMARRG